MKNIDLSSYKPRELLRLYSEIMRELRNQGVLRTHNNPVADYAEYIVSQTLHLELCDNSIKGYDAIDRNNIRYQIKGRRLTVGNPSCQLGVIRSIDKKEFDFLIAVLFNEDFSVKNVYKIPHHIIKKYSRFHQRMNGMILHLQGAVLLDPEIEDITKLF